jgi:uncharacterized membrane protein YhaH (DUF805 family)
MALMSNNQGIIDPFTGTAWLQPQDPVVQVDFVGEVPNMAYQEDEDMAAIAYAYAIIVGLFVVPFVMHVAVGCCGLVHEYFRCLMIRFSDTKTRSRRREFIGFELTHLCILYDLLLLDKALGFDVLFEDQQMDLPSPGYLTVAYFALSFVPHMCLKVRRLHDTGRPAYWLLLELFPGLSFIPGVIMWFFDSESRTNEYGANPKGIVDAAMVSNEDDEDILEKGLVTSKQVDTNKLATSLGYTKVMDDISLGPSCKM